MFKYINYVSIFVATVLEVPFSVLKKVVCPRAGRYDLRTKRFTI